MRVITGRARGVRLETVPGEEIVRPTSQRVKEAMFSAIQFEIEGQTVCDAFAGSGQLGIEALSRGAKSCLFLELDPRAHSIVNQNIAHAKLEQESKLMQLDSLQYLKRTGEMFGLIFLDPPFGTTLLQEAIPVAAQRLEPGGLLVCEALMNESLPEQIDDVALRKSYKHGRTKICVYQKEIAQ